MHKKRDIFLRFQKIALDVSHGFGRNKSIFLIVVFLIKKHVFQHGVLRKIGGALESWSAGALMKTNT